MWDRIAWREGQRAEIVWTALCGAWGLGGFLGSRDVLLTVGQLTFLWPPGMLGLMAFRGSMTAAKAWTLSAGIWAILTIIVVTASGYGAVVLFPLLSVVLWWLIGLGVIRFVQFVRRRRRAR